jgi:peptide/nickel transport system permease protein
VSLTRFILRRVLLLIPTLFGVSLLTFALSRIVPGDPARLAAGAQATPEMYAQIRQEFGLDDPLPVQYWNYLSGLFQGDWGRSILSRRPVLDDLSVYWPATFELVLFSMLIAVALGAVRADRPADQISRVVALLGVSLPAFWLAILFQIFFGLRLGWLPVSGRLASLSEAPPEFTGLYTVDSLVSGQWATFGDSVRQLLLPAITLSFPAMATIMRFTRATLLETLGQDYVRTARAKGATERQVVARHALRNALIPTITMVGLSFGWAMGGSVLVETVFDWPGLGLYATKSALSLDFSVINILVDVTYGALDPRVSRV